MVEITSQCESCKLYNKELNVCHAFPREIPEDILFNRFDHRRPYDGDNGFRWTEDRLATFRGLTNPYIGRVEIERGEDGALRKVWSAFTTHHGTIGAVNEQGHKLYGEEAQRALQNKPETTSPTDTVAAENVPPPTSAEEIRTYVERVRQDPAIRRAEAAFAEANEGLDTRSQFAPEGQWAPERSRLHEEVASEMLVPSSKAKEGERPKAVLTIGMPGSGKSTAVKPHLVSIREGEWTTVDPDRIKARLPGYRGSDAPKYHEESSYVAKALVRDRAISEGHHIVFDQVGSKPEKMSALVDLLADRGYEVHVVMADVPEWKSLHRVVGRYKSDLNKGKGGRLPPLDYVIEEVDGNVRRTYEALKNHPGVSSWASYDNSVDNREAVLTDSGKRNVYKFLKLIKGVNELSLPKKPGPGATAAEVAAWMEEYWLTLLASE